MRSTQSFTLTAALLSALRPANAAYTLVQTYDHTNFFNEFSFFTGTDPTAGYVEYVEQSIAQNAGLIEIENNQVYVGVDHTTYNPAGGRESVRLTSNEVFTHGLFIADIEHMPGGICGTWPAFWTFGPNWPDNGEIDIIEGVNAQTTDQVTLHTRSGCSVSNDNSLAGTNTLETNCNENDGYNGCGASTSNVNNYGTGFNSVGGGVYAMQWASSGIYVWFWQRSEIPSDISNETPDTASWGQPLASFSSGNGGCDFDDYFANHNIIFDTTFCGSWAGQASTWDSSTCSNLATTCQEYVANNPAAFTDAYWLINSVKVYQ